jgi:hypothetical protein
MVDEQGTSAMMKEKWHSFKCEIVGHIASEGVQSIDKDLCKESWDG